MLNTGLRTSDIPALRPRRIELEGRGVLIVREGTRISAFDEVCPHKQLSMQHGVVHGGKLICPWHQYAFDFETGAGPRRCPPATVFETALDEEGFICVDLGPAPVQ